MNFKTLGKKILVIIISLLLWEVIVKIGLIDAYILPPPSKILPTVLKLFENKDFIFDIFFSLKRVGIALVSSIFIGSLLGLAMGYSKKAQIIIQPLALVTQPIPKIMLYPILIVLLGFGDLTRTVFIFLGCLYVILFAAYQGAKNVSTNLIDAARSLGAKDMKVFTSVVFPHSLPYIAGGMKSAVGIALILMFFSETIGTQRGLGYFIVSNWGYLNMENVFAGIIVTSIIGVILVGLVELIERKFLIWES